MPYADTPLTDAIRDAVAAEWKLDAFGHCPRLFGGEESSAFRVGDCVVRIGPTWRTTAELEWCHRVAQTAAENVPEALAPLPNAAGTTVMRVDDHPVSVWPFVEGSWADHHDADQRRQAASLLARLHLALAAPRTGFEDQDRPTGAGTATTWQHGRPDPGLDEWLRDFDTQTSRRQPIHGDFYAGNLLTRNGRIVAVLDWDEAILSRPERELAWAAWEFGNGLWADNLDQVWRFIDNYKTAGGPADEIDEITLRNLVAQRLRGEMHYADHHCTTRTAEDRAYRQRQEHVYEHLRAPSNNTTRQSRAGRSNHPVIQGHDVRLRPTSQGELPTLRRFFTDPGFYEHWDGYPKSDDEILAKFTGARSPEVECFIVETAGIDVGFVQYHISDETGGGMDMVLMPEARGQRIGSAVVHAVAEFVHVELGWQELRVDPDVTNTRGVNFWRKVGFKPEGIIHDYDGRGPFWRMRWPYPAAPRARE